MTQYAFQANGQFDGATASLPNGDLVDIGKLLGKSGRIETDDEQLAIALSNHPAVKPASVSKPAASTPAPTSEESED